MRARVNSQRCAVGPGDRGRSTGSRGRGAHGCRATSRVCVTGSCVLSSVPRRSAGGSRPGPGGPPSRGSPHARALARLAVARPPCQTRMDVGHVVGDDVGDDVGASLAAVRPAAAAAGVARGVRVAVGRVRQPQRGQLPDHAGPVRARHGLQRAHQALRGDRRRRRRPWATSRSFAASVPCCRSGTARSLPMRGASPTGTSGIASAVSADRRPSPRLRAINVNASTAIARPCSFRAPIPPSSCASPVATVS